MSGAKPAGLVRRVGRTVVPCMVLLLTLPVCALAAPNTAYVANYVSPGYVSQFTIGAGGQLAANGTISSGGNEAWYQAITPDGKHLYVTNDDSTTVAQYDVGANGQLTPLSPATVTTGSEPVGIAISPDGKSAYVANYIDSTISLFNIGSDGSLTPKSPATVSTNINEPYGVAVSPDGKSLYVTNSDNNTVAQFDVASDGTLTAKSTSTVATGTFPTFITLTPSGQNAYVTNYEDGTVSQYSVGAGGNLAPIGTPAPAGPADTNLYSATVSPDGKSLYAPNGSSVYQFNIGSGGTLSAKTPTSVAGGGEAENIWLSADGKNAYLANYNDGDASTVSEYNVGADGTLTPKSTPSTPSTGPASVIIPPDQGPVASFSASPAASGSSTKFNGTTSTDADGTVVRYEWTFGDGQSAQNAGPTPTHAYRTAGTYTVTLTVTDDSGCSASFVFTGQTAYCNGSSSATKTEQITVKPGVKIAKAKISSKHHLAKFRFKAIGTASKLQCALVRVRAKRHHKKPKPKFSKCHSPKTYKHLKAGKYIFEVRALSKFGTGPPVERKFRIH